MSQQTHLYKKIMTDTQPVMDIFPWPNGMGFEGAKNWWAYVARQPEANKLQLLMMTAHLSKEVCHLLLAHDQDLFTRFQLTPATISRLSTIQANCLSKFVAQLIEQDEMSGDAYG